MAADSVLEPIGSDGWTHWMGPNLDGISTETGWSTDWPESGLPVLWSREVGIGFSSLSVSGGHAYTMGHLNGKEFVYCLDADTGATIWQHGYPCALVDNLYEGGPGATPTVFGDRLFAVGKEGQVHCLRRGDGKVLWQRKLQDDLGVPLPEWGFDSSPRIVGDLIVLEAGCVVAYDIQSGELRWKTDEHLAGYGSVMPFEIQGEGLLASLDCDGLRVTRSKDGTQVAFTSWDSPFRTNSTTPIVVGDRIYISTGYNRGCALFQLQNESLNRIYASREMCNHFNNSILLDGYLYGFDGNSNRGRVVQLTCQKFDTGEIMWQQRGLGCGSLMIVDKKLLILADDGTLVLAQASPDGFQEITRSAFLEGRCWTVPVFVNRRVYGRNAAGKLVCVEVPESQNPIAVPAT